MNVLTALTPDNATVAGDFAETQGNDLLAHAYRELARMLSPVSTCASMTPATERALTRNIEISRAARSKRYARRGGR